jgi:hypothetical protein
MLISEIDFNELTDRTSPSRWGANTKLDRRQYQDSAFIYKAWGADYLTSGLYTSGDQWCTHKKALSKPHGFEVGLFVPQISSAFVDFIVDENDVVRGYITKIGTPPVRGVPDVFVEDVFNACVACGWLFCDFCYNNIVEVDGTFSLIDFDTHLTELACLDLDFEKKSGALREHVDSRFRDLVINYVCSR